MLNLGSKTSPSSRTLSIPSNFWNYNWSTETGISLTFMLLLFLKNNLITISVTIILNINQWSLYYLKKVSYGQIDMLITIKYVVIFHKLLFEVTKIGVRLINWCVYPARPSDTVTQYTIYPLSHWWKDYSNGLGPYLATLSYG